MKKKTKSKPNNKILLIISCIYNNQPLVQQCVEAVMKNTNTQDLECYYVLVNNHPQDEHTLDYLKTSQILDFNRNIKTKLIDPGENIGCHRGFNYGYLYAQNRLNLLPDYVVKLDDDTIVPHDWNLPMIKVLDADPNLAYISSIDQNAKLGSDFKIKKVEHYHLEIPQKYNVGFSCVMFPIRTIKQFGLLMNRKTLYGHEESEYYTRIKAAGLYGAYIQEMVAQHLGNEDRDIDYVAWKYWYGLMHATDQDLIGFKANRQELIKCWKHMQTRRELWWQEQAKKRLQELQGNWFKNLFLRKR